MVLHGVTGTSKDTYMQELGTACAENGINVVLFNHYASDGEIDLRLMDLGLNRYLDEVLAFTQNKFGSEGQEVDIYLAGFSLGGNHILRYVGLAAKNKMLNKCEDRDHSPNVKAVISISGPFDVKKTGLALQNTYFGIFDKIIAWS